MNWYLFPILLKGSPCCYLKEIVPGQNPNDGLVSGLVYHNMYNHPPSGMRSAVPLGILIL